MTQASDKAVEAALWQPIESAPRDGSYIMIWFVGEPRVVRWVEPDNPTWQWALHGEAHGSHNVRCVKYWRPLPSPPKE